LALGGPLSSLHTSVSLMIADGRAGWKDEFGHVGREREAECVRVARVQPQRQAAFQLRHRVQHARASASVQTARHTHKCAFQSSLIELRSCFQTGRTSCIKIGGEVGTVRAMCIRLSDTGEKTMNSKVAVK
jgi:hypothetical protein